MRLTFRVAIAVALVFTIFLVKNHLSSIDEKWQTDRSANRVPVPDFILDRAGTHIELVSGDDIAAAEKATSTSVAVSRVSSTSISTSTTQGFLEPTGPPVTPKQFEPETIPVEVPGSEFYDDLFSDDYLDTLDYEFGSRYGHNQPPPKPKATPKPPVPKLTDRIVVLGRMSWEDSDWLEEELPE